MTHLLLEADYERSLSLIEDGHPKAALKVLSQLCEDRAETPYCGDCDHCKLGQAIGVLEKRLAKETVKRNGDKTKD